jgi:hypothetical protein
MSNRQFWILITVIVLGFAFLSVPDWVRMYKASQAEREDRQVGEVLQPVYVQDLKTE